MKILAFLVAFLFCIAFVLVFIGSRADDLSVKEVVVDDFWKNEGTK